MKNGLSFVHRKALTILEVVVSVVILSVVLGTYGSAARATQRLLYELKLQPVYTRLAFLQLERMMDLVHRLELPESDYYSNRGSRPPLGFVDITRIFSFEGRAGKLDEYNAADDARIPLLQMQLYGENNSAEERFLAFPFPEELKIGYFPWNYVSDISRSGATLHNVTSFLNTEVSTSGSLLYRSVLPLVSDEFLYIADITEKDPQNRYSEMGWSAAGGIPLAAADVPTLLPFQLFTDEVAGDTETDAVEFERVRRYVYYRKIRENNIVFRNGVEGRKDPDSHLTSNSIAHFEESFTDIDMLYIQNLNDWDEVSGSSNEGELVDVLGKSDQSLTQGLGALGSHSILIMVVVRELPSHLSGRFSEADFLKEATVKAVAVGIAAPSFGKNILATSDLSFHRYAGTRIPGVKMR
jgi:hypothetical protein